MEREVFIPGGGQVERGRHRGAGGIAAVRRRLGIVAGLDIGEFSGERIDASVAVLVAGAVLA